MQTIKRRAGLTRSSNQRQQACKRGRKTRISSSDLGEVGWRQLSQELASMLSPSIVSLASFDDGTMYSQCTGIVIQNDQYGASFLTSSDLVTTSDTNRWMIPTLKIKVRLPNFELINGVVQHYRLPYHMLVVTTEHFPDLRTTCLSNSVQVESLTELLAVRRCYNSGKLMTRSGKLIESPNVVESEGFMSSTCLITADGSGGPLVDFDGNIVGMNCYENWKITPFVPTNRILECLGSLRYWSCMPKNSSPSNFCSDASSDRDSSSRVSSSRDSSTGGSENEKQEPCGVWCELDQKLASKLSPSVISLASFDGETLHSECTGIVIDSKLSSPAFLTSKSLYRDVNGECILNMTIKVRLPNDEVVDAWLHEYRASYNLVVVRTDPLTPFPELHLARLSNSMQDEEAAELLAVRRCFKSGKLMTASWVLISSPSGVVSKDKLSTCKITEAASGGPVVDLYGNIVGMNYYDRETTLLVPSNLISECLGPESWSGSNQDGCSTRKISTNEIQTSSTPYNNCPEEVTDQVQPAPILAPTAAELTDDDLKRILQPWPSADDLFTKTVNDFLRDSGYPLPSFADGGMYLKGNFEEEFGEDICSKSIEKVASQMSRYVVALASFDDEGRRYFACTGVLINCNKSTSRVLTSASLIRTSGGENKIDKLRIEVCLPSKRRVPGTLQRYDLNYNVAVVCISGVRISGVRISGVGRRIAAELSETLQTKVVALGRGFRSGDLMVTDGVVTGERSRFDCEELEMCTCKITKAGIGGPLVDFDGNFVGLNFYDMEKTPYIPRNIILEFMSQFNSERTVAADVTKKSNSKRWPVPDPYWVYPTRYRQAVPLEDRED